MPHIMYLLCCFFVFSFVCRDYLERKHLLEGGPVAAAAVGGPCSREPRGSALPRPLHCWAGRLVVSMLCSAPI